MEQKEGLANMAQVSQGYGPQELMHPPRGLQMLIWLASVFPSTLVSLLFKNSIQERETTKEFEAAVVRARTPETFRYV